MSIVKRRSERDEFVYLVRLRDPDGRVYNRTFRTKAEAKRWELDQRGQLARGGWIDPRGAETTVTEIADALAGGEPVETGERFGARRDGGSPLPLAHPGPTADRIGHAP